MFRTMCVSYKEKTYWVVDIKILLEVNDDNIANLLHIPLETYLNLLENFGAIFLTIDCEEESYFLTECQCRQFCDYLNNEYGIVLKLMGEI